MVSNLKINNSFEQLEASIKSINNRHDSDYYIYHRKRYEHCVSRIVNLFENRNARILDIGSHYLHVACLIQYFGLGVTGIDVPVFCSLPFVEERARQYGINNICVSDVSDGLFLPRYEDQFDCILMNEIIEHITFNPIMFWKRIYEIIKPGGFIYITTPNALSLSKIIRAAYRVFTLSGVGINIQSIFENVTYGHHWKEYSSAELSRYFRYLSPDFSVNIGYYSYDKPSADSGRRHHSQIKPRIARWIDMLGRRTRIFSDNLEVIIRLDERTQWNPVPPRFA